MLSDFACEAYDSVFELDDLDDGISDNDSDGEDLQMFCAQELDSETRPWCPLDLGTVATVSEPASVLIDLPISSDGLTANDFIIPTCEELAAAQSQDFDLQLLRTWLNKQQTPTANDHTPHSG